MKKTMYIITGYTLALLFCLSFFFTMYVIFQYSWLIGGLITGLLVFTAFTLINDPDSYMEVEESMPLHSYSA
ncbi:MAG: hypothetical protein AAFP19_12055 [Bacteroidota bacterium]